MVMCLTLSAVGCATKDHHVFKSTVNQPTTVTLLDVHQNQAVWEMDVPVNHQLVLDFENSAGSGSNAVGVAESWADWKLYRSDDQPTDTGRDRKGSMIQSDRIDLTGTAVRMHVSYRPAPELPGSVSAAPVPVVETAESVAAEAIAEAKAAGAQSAPEPAPAVEEAPVEAEVEAAAVVEEAEAVAEEAAEVVVEEADAVEEAAEVVEEAADEATK